MGITILNSFDSRAGVILKLQSFPERPFGVALDSYLRLKRNGANHILTLVLTIHLKQASALALSPWLPRGRTPFFARPEKRAEWIDFERRFKLECRRWNDRFWLIPPARFSKLDVKIGGRSVRPNISCQLQVDVLAGPTGAHRTIEVVNLEHQLIAAARQTDCISGALQSSMGLCKSQDPVPGSRCSGRHRGQTTRHVGVPTAAEQIADALGLEPIGVDSDPPFFTPARPASDGAAADETGIAGTRQSAPDAIGLGSNLPEPGAAPWLDRIAVQTQTNPRDWTVSLLHPSPKPV
jgi:hypothetical protein